MFGNSPTLADFQNQLARIKDDNERLFDLREQKLNALDAAEKNFSQVIFSEKSRAETVLILTDHALKKINLSLKKNSEDAAALQIKIDRLSLAVSSSVSIISNDIHFSFNYMLPNSKTDKHKLEYSIWADFLKSLSNSNPLIIELALIKFYSQMRAFCQRNNLNIFGVSSNESISMWLQMAFSAICTADSIKNKNKIYLVKQIINNANFFYKNQKNTIAIWGNDTNDENAFHYAITKLKSSEILNELLNRLNKACQTESVFKPEEFNKLFDFKRSNKPKLIESLAQTQDKEMIKVANDFIKSISGTLPPMPEVTIAPASTPLPKPSTNGLFPPKQDYPTVVEAKISNEHQKLIQIIKLTFESLVSFNVTHKYFETLLTELAKFYQEKNSKLANQISNSFIEFSYLPEDNKIENNHDVTTKFDTIQQFLKLVEENSIKLCISKPLTCNKVINDLFEYLYKVMSPKRLLEAAFLKISLTHLQNQIQTKVVTSASNNAQVNLGNILYNKGLDCLEKKSENLSNVSDEMFVYSQGLVLLMDAYNLYKKYGTTQDQKETLKQLAEKLESLGDTFRDRAFFHVSTAFYKQSLQLTKDLGAAGFNLHLSVLLNYYDLYNKNEADSSLYLQSMQEYINSHDLTQLAENKATEAEKDEFAFYVGFLKQSRLNTNEISKAKI